MNNEKKNTNETITLKEIPESIYYKIIERSSETQIGIKMKLKFVKYNESKVIHGIVKAVKKF